MFDIKGYWVATCIVCTAWIHGSVASGAMIFPNYGTVGGQVNVGGRLQLLFHGSAIATRAVTLEELDGDDNVSDHGTSATIIGVPKRNENVNNHDMGLLLEVGTSSINSVFAGRSDPWVSVTFRDRLRFSSLPPIDYLGVPLTDIRFVIESDGIVQTSGALSDAQLNIEAGTNSWYFATQIYTFGASHYDVLSNLTFSGTLERNRFELTTVVVEPVDTYMQLGYVDFVLGFEGKAFTNSSIGLSEAMVQSMNSLKVTGLQFGLADGTVVTPESMGITPIFESGLSSPNLLLSAVPEPASLTLLGLGAIGMAIGAFRSRKRDHLDRSPI